jgi:uncharacterized protein (DUF1778 family)
LIRANAPKILEQQANIEVTNQQFDQFMTICMDKSKVPSPRILEAAQRLDREGL